MIILVGCGKKSIFSPHDVRNSDWHDSAESVRAAEKIEPKVDIGNRISYEDTFLGYDSTITYIFLNDELGQVSFEIRCDNEATAIDTFNDISEKLTKAYGAKDKDKSSDTSHTFETKDTLIWLHRYKDNVSADFAIPLDISKKE